MKERLIELMRIMNATPEITCPRFNKQDCKGCEFEKGLECDTAGRKANYLIENNVIALPCKVGQKAYVIHNTVERIELGLKDCIYETVIDAIHISGTIEYHLYYKKIVHPDCDFFTDKDIGETVFFARKEAEQKLKERDIK